MTRVYVTMDDRVIDRLTLGSALRSELPDARSWCACVRRVNYKLHPFGRCMVGHKVSVLTPRGLTAHEIRYEICRLDYDDVT